MTCVFCDNVRSSGDLVFEDDRVWIVVHPGGHLMLVAKRHVENVSDLPEDDWLHFARVWHRAERVLLDLTQTDRAIVMKLGIQTPHLHVHLYPFRTEASREEVFAAIDGKTREPRDEAFVARIRMALSIVN